MSAAVYELAAGVRTELPWVKIILGLREPISHQIAAKAYIVEMLKNPAGWARARWGAGRCAFLALLATPTRP
jgi:hypothetical protein